MKIKLVVVDLELSTRAKRLAAALAIPLLVLGGGAVAYASVPHTWNDGDTLTAADLNTNFADLDTRVMALGAYLVGESSNIETGSLYSDVVYQSAQLDLTPGTWLVTGTTQLTTTINSDAVQIGLWNDTVAVEVPQSRSALGRTADAAKACDGVLSFCSFTALTTTVVVTVATNTTLKLEAFRNGSSQLQVGVTALALPSTTRLTAVRVK